MTESKHRALPKIAGFHNSYKRLKLVVGLGNLPDHLTFHAKIKLHGTNAAIRFSPDGTITGQKRTDDVSVGNDNCGFAVRVESMRPMLEEWYDWFITQYPTAAKHDVVIHGEWAGPGIQKNVAVSDIPSKHFFIFAISEGPKGGPTNMTFDAAAIRAMLHEGNLSQADWRHHGVRVLPNFGTFTFDPRFREGVQKFADEVNDIVEKIGDCDPYIKEVFGVEGIGEGLVFYPHGEFGGSIYCSQNQFDEYSFKVKDERHAVNKAGKPARVHSATPESAFHFADMHATEPRFEQFETEILRENGIDHADSKFTGQFIGMICRDIALESASEIEESGMDWKRVLSGVIATRAREWWLKRCEAI